MAAKRKRIAKNPLAAACRAYTGADAHVRAMEGCMEDVGCLLLAARMTGAGPPPRSLITGPGFGGGARHHLAATPGRASSG